MSYLGETSIIVVDDEPKHGLAVVRALNQEGLGVAYYTGDVEELPQTALSGVRLAVLDMDLSEGDVAGREPAARLAPLLSVLGRLVARTNGPYVATVWTSHPELVAEFKRQFSRMNPTTPPMFITPLDKAEFYKGEEFDSEKLQIKLLESVAKAWPLSLLIGWESYSRRASSEVVSQLTQSVFDGRYCRGIGGRIRCAPPDLGEEAGCNSSGPHHRDVERERYRDPSGLRGLHRTQRNGARPTREAHQQS